MKSSPSLPPSPLHDRRRVERTDLVLLDERQRFRLELRREVDHVLRQKSLPLDRWRLGGEGLRRRIPLARHRAFLDRPLFDGPHRLAGLAIEHEDEALLGRLRDGRDLPAVDGDVDQDRRARHVVIPDRMVHELVVPDALAGLQIDRDQAFRRTGCCRGDARRNSRRSESRRADRRCRAARPRSSASTRRCCRCTPTTFRATCRCRTRRDAEWCGRSTAACRCAGRRRGCNPWRWLAAARRGAGAMRGADEDDVLGDDRRAVPRDLALNRIELLIGVLLQIDDAVDAEVLERHAGLRVEPDQLVADGDVEDPLVGLAVGPVADTAARQSARRALRAAPSSSRCIHSSSPVAASSATALRCSPAVA